jgi:phospholipid/cholesterol/gamma-HCH transport system substrate-binding protein
MPNPKKIAWSQLKVGIVAILAVFLLLALVFLMAGVDNPFAEKAFLYTFLGDSAAMTEGSGVRLNGILIGKVKRIEHSGDRNNNRAIRMTIEIGRQHLPRIPVDSEVGFSAENVLGAKFLNIKRGVSQETVKDGGELHARDDRDFLEVVQSALPLLESLRTILSRIDKIVGQVEAGRGSIGKLLFDDDLYRRANGMLEDVQKVTDSVARGEGTIGRLLYDEGLYHDLRGMLARLDGIAASIERGEGTAGRLLKDPALYDELRKSTAEVRALLADLNAGKGSAGRLLKDEALHNRLVATVDRLNATMDKLDGGQGTLGQLMVNPALYETLVGTSVEIQSLMKDFRANPKKFLSIQLKIF